jgi:UPF0755 protein
VAVRYFLTGLVVFALALVAAAYLWVDRPLEMPAAGVDVTIAPGSSAKSVAAAMAQAGVQVNPDVLYLWLRASGKARQIKAGSYAFQAPLTPRSLLAKLLQGHEVSYSITLLEGWSFRQVLAALAKAPELQNDSAPLKPDTLMTRLGKPGVHPEGRFFPDTYTYAKGSSDMAVLRRAMRTMDAKLEAAWSARAPDSILKTPAEALILASIVEKETGAPEDRAQIAAVFHNRLRMGMRLQTDPTVIYGLGEKFDGNLRKVDLLTDTPWNSYTRAGLPPTPIAMPGNAALLAAVQPLQSKALYFVARGDGSSQFSATLDEHNRAVNKFQRGQ